VTVFGSFRTQLDFPHEPQMNVGRPASPTRRHHLPPLLVSIRFPAGASTKCSSFGVIWLVSAKRWCLAQQQQQPERIGHSHLARGESKAVT